MDNIPNMKASRAAISTISNSIPADSIRRDVRRREPSELFAIFTLRCRKHTINLLIPSLIIRHFDHSLAKRTNYGRSDTVGLCSEQYMPQCKSSDNLGVSHLSNRLRRLDLADYGLTIPNTLLLGRFSMRSVGLSQSGIHRDFVPAGAKRAFRFRLMNCV
jgi:hypothetical protein